MIEIHNIKIKDYVKIGHKYYRIVGSAYYDKSKKNGSGRRPTLKLLKDVEMAHLIGKLNGDIKQEEE